MYIKDRKRQTHSTYLGPAAAAAAAAGVGGGVGVSHSKPIYLSTSARNPYIILWSAKSV